MEGSAPTEGDASSTSDKDAFVPINGRRANGFEGAGDGAGSPLLRTLLWVGAEVDRRRFGLAAYAMADCTTVCCASWRCSWSLKSSRFLKAVLLGSLSRSAWPIFSRATCMATRYHLPHCLSSRTNIPPAERIWVYTESTSSERSSRVSA